MAPTDVVAMNTVTATNIATMAIMIETTIVAIPTEIELSIMPSVAHEQRRVLSG